jgi:putative ATPase
MWGPPGSGKTTLARLLADEFDARFVQMSAVMAGVADIREEVEKADKQGPLFDKETVLFIDEIHRFSKNQQDALLPHVEAGTITLVGATTENPSFEVNSALLSRCQVLVLEALDDKHVSQIIDRALEDEKRGLGRLNLELSEEARNLLTDSASGDARIALNALELAARAVESQHREMINSEDAGEAIRRHLDYDKSGSKHYQLASAFIKSMRGSDPDAALYYMNRMLEGGEDPKFVLRRMLIFASEDIGNADPRALDVAVNAFESFQAIGMPEGALPMTQAVIYMSKAPKSNAVIEAYAKARQAVNEHGNAPIPDHIVNAPTDLNKKIGHGRGYKYPHNYSGHYLSDEEYLPEPLHGETFVELSDQGFEKRLKNRFADTPEPDSEN